MKTILLNPRFPEDFKAEMEGKLKGLLEEHFWLMTSGTTGQAKAVALSKEALLSSAQAVNAHLESNEKDVWLHCLPNFHVGGLGIEFRSQLSGANVLRLKKWCPNRFVYLCQSATLSALVPTQVYDLLQLGIEAPRSLRAIIVGGGALSDYMYQRAEDLGWPLLPSYGLTECCSQVATAKLGSPALHLLDHIQVEITNKGTIAIKSPSLLTAYWENDSLCDPKISGWLETEDLGELKGNVLTVKGRAGDFVKVSGENVHMKPLQHLLEKIKLESSVATPLFLVAEPDGRLGHALHLVVENEITPPVQQVIDAYQTQVLPFERIQKVRIQDKMIRNFKGAFVRE